MKKLALICALVFMVGAIPVFAEINNTTDDTSNSSGDSSSTNVSTDGSASNSNSASSVTNTEKNNAQLKKQHRYQHKNKDASGAAVKHRYGQTNDNKGSNCPHAECGTCDHQKTQKHNRLHDGSCKS
ncbi:MAG: hypothetical protein ACP5C3_10065 [Methanomicrobiales archaeon]